MALSHLLLLPSMDSLAYLPTRHLKVLLMPKALPALPLFPRLPTLLFLAPMHTGLGRKAFPFSRQVTLNSHRDVFSVAPMTEPKPGYGLYSVKLLTDFSERAKETLCP